MQPHLRKLIENAYYRTGIVNKSFETVSDDYINLALDYLLEMRPKLEEKDEYIIENLTHKLCDHFSISYPDNSNNIAVSK